CGSSDHKRTNHKLCPLNKKKKAVERVGSNVPGAVRDVSEIPGLNAEHKEARSASGPHLLNDVDMWKHGASKKTSHKSCPLFRGAIKDRFKVGDEEESFCTVKMGLNQFLACSLEDNEKQALTDVVNDAVQRLTDLSCEASRMLNGFCIWLMENNHAFPDLRDPKLAYCDASGLSSIVNSIAKEYPTNALNHVQMNIVRFTLQYVDFILSREVGPELTRKTYNQVKQFILAELERNSSDSNLKRFPFEALMSEHDALFASIIKIWDTARDVLQCRNLTKSVVKNEWWLYIPSMYQMLKVVCANYKEIAEERKKSRKRGRALRLYYLVPLCHYQQRHIPIDSSGLHEIMSLAKLHGTFDSMKRDDVYDNPYLYWRSVFELRKVETFCDGYKLEVADYQLILTKTKVPSRWFGYHITTDGVQVGISVLKPLNEATVNEWGVEEKEVFHHLEGTPITITVAFDPGRRNLYDAVAGDEDSRE
ncbi:hypothetical protein MP638_001592, partial [Amoeboaphelidium occidentale]